MSDHDEANPPPTMYSYASRADPPGAPPRYDQSVGWEQGAGSHPSGSESTAEQHLAAVIRPGNAMRLPDSDRNFVDAFRDVHVEN